MEIIYRLFGIRRSKNQRRAILANYPQERKGHDSQQNEREEDPPLPSQSDWTCDEQTYKYSIKESPKDAWESCNSIVDDHDEDLCKELKEEISFLLVVAGLFLAVVTAFTVESYRWLKEDKEDKMADLLGEVVRLLNNTSAQGSARSPSPFIPAERDVVVNQIWFLSMIISLVAVMFGTFCLQWVSAFRQNQRDVTNKSVSPADALALRQLRFDGMVGWYVLRAPAILLFIVQTSIVLFTIGLVYLLWGISLPAALPTVIVASAAGVLLYLANLMPFVQPLVGAVFPATQAIPQCPYKSPTSWLVHGIGVVSTAPCLVPFRYFLYWHGGSRGERICDWLDQQRGLLTDYLWQRYDDLCRDLREDRGPQSGSGYYSYYLVRGIASAMSILVFEPNAVDIIPSCIQMLRRESRDPETWEKLFHTKLSRAEKALLRGNVSLGGEDNNNPITSAARIKNLKRDFLNAHVFQYLVVHSQKLRRILLRHRVELYIRIKNSCQGITIGGIRGHILLGRRSNTTGGGDNQDDPIGSSVICPVESAEDAQEMSQDLKIQFLSCAKRLLGTKQFTDADTLGTAWVVASENVQVNPTSEKSGNTPSGENQSNLGVEGGECAQPVTGGDEDPIKEGEIIEPVYISSPQTDLPVSPSDAQSPKKGEADTEPKPVEPLAELCQHMRLRLGELPQTAFSDGFYFRRSRVVLGLDPYPSPPPDPQPSGSDSV